MRTNKDLRQIRDRQAMREANAIPGSSIVDIDPEDPSQLLDDAGQFSVVELDLEAQPFAEASAELEDAVADSAGEEEAADHDALASGESAEAPRAYAPEKDTGELYGVHLPRASDRDFDIDRHGEQYEDAELGEHVFETISKQTAELGSDPDHDVDVVDDSEGEFKHRDNELPHHSTDRRDRPVADKGSGGVGGL